MEDDLLKALNKSLLENDKVTIKPAIEGVEAFVKSIFKPQKTENDLADLVDSFINAKCPTYHDKKDKGTGRCLD